MFAVTWYAKDLGEGGQGSRITFVDRETRRYRHVLLVVPRLAEDGSLQVLPLRVHAGGVVWCGDYLHVAATARGFMTFRLDDLMRLPDERFRQPATGSGWTATGCPPTGIATCCRSGSPTRRSRRLATRSCATRSCPSTGRSRHLTSSPASTPPVSRDPRDWSTTRWTPSRCCCTPARTASRVRSGSRTEGRRAHAGRGGRRRQVLPLGVEGPLSGRLGVRRPPGRLPPVPDGDADGAGGPLVVAIDRRAVVGHRAPRPTLGLQHAARLVRPVRPRWVRGRLTGAGGPADGSAPPASRRSPRPRSPPRTCHRPCCGSRAGPSASPAPGGHARGR